MKAWIMKESKLQRDIQKAARKHGWFPIKIHGNKFQMAGIPDLLCIKKARLRSPWHQDIHEPATQKNVTAKYIWIEVKLPGKKLEPNQEKMIEHLKSLGCVVGVAESVKEAMEVLCGPKESREPQGS